MTVTSNPIAVRLSAAALRFDRRNCERADRRGTYYNRYALAQYLFAVDDIAAAIDRGVEPREAIEAKTYDRLRTALLKAL